MFLHRCITDDGDFNLDALVDDIINNNDEEVPHLISLI